MNWKNLTSQDQLDALVIESANRPQLIFKHSIRCSISAMVKGRLDREQAPAHIDFYYLDLINNRAVSNQVAELFGVTHESPQVLLIRDGKAIYDESHNGITMKEILSQGVTAG